VTTPSRNIRRQRGTGTIRADGEDKWIVRAPVGGKQVSRTVHGTRRDAEKRLRALLTEVDSGYHRERKRTVADLLAKWYDLVAPDRSPQTTRRYESHMRVHLLPALGDLPLDRLGPAEIDALYAEMRKTMRPGSVHDVHNVLNTACKYGVKIGWLVANPCQRASPPRGKSRPITPPSWEDVGLLVSTAMERDPQLAVIVFLAAATGMRRGELCGLRWSSINGATVNVWQSVIDVKGTQRTQVKGTKTERYRTIAIDPKVPPILDAHRRRQEARATNAGVELAPKAFVFSDLPTCALPLRPSQVTHRFDKLRDRCGLPTVRLHDLRHAHGTYLMQQGFSAVDVGGRLGHSGGQLVHQLYGHFAPAQDVLAAATLGAVLPALPETTKAPPPDPKAE
jgi:integrase